MTALLMERMRMFERWTFKRFAVAPATAKIWKHALVGFDLSTGKVEPAHAEVDLFIIGVANETIDNSAGALEVTVDVNLGTEIEVEWWASGGGISAANVGSLCYALDDNTVTLTANGCVAGRIWAYDSARGVAVQKLPVGSGGGGVGTPTIAAPPFAGGDLALPASPAPGIIALPFTAANSTVTLPATAADGTQLLFVADGVANGHTVQYRDAGGPLALTAALPAFRRHCVLCVYLGGKWFVNAYVSP